MQWPFAVEVAQPIRLDITFVIDAQQSPLVALVGPNGAGKSTLLRTMAGLNGLKHGGRGPAWKRRLTWVPQEPSLFRHRTIRQQVEWVAGQRLAAVPGLSEWVEILGLADALDERPGALSGGRQQRGALLRALAARPSGLLLDEALSQIDAPSREAIIWSLKEWAEAVEDRFVMLTTHQFSEVGHLADQVLVMAQGCLLRSAAPESLLAQLASWAVASLIGYVACVAVDGEYIALRSHEVAALPPGRAATARVVSRRGRRSIVDLEAVAGRRRFVIEHEGEWQAAGEAATVYLRGPTVAFEEGR